MALLNPLYTAPLPAGFISGTVEIKSPGTYVDQAGRVQQPSYRFAINADGSLTSLQVGGASSIVGMGLGDRQAAPMVDIVIEIRVAGSPVPLRTPYRLSPLDSGGGTLRLQQENQAAPTIVTASVLANLANQTALYVMGTENIAIGATSLAVETFQPVAPAAASAPFALTLTGTVNAASYGAVDGANVSTIMATIAAAPDGSTIIIPRGNYTHTGGRLMLTGRKRLKIFLNGSTIKATATLADLSAGQNGGFYFVACEEIDVYDGTYDGALDTRTPYGSDLANTNLKSGWNVLTGCKGIRLHNVFGNRCMMDGIYVGHSDDTITGQPVPIQANMPINTVLDNCGGDGNYRQGLSVVGCNVFTMIGTNAFHNTGKTGGKGTAPMAGVDFEAYVASGFYNFGVSAGTIVANGNVGHALLIEQGTDGAVFRGLAGRGNGGGIAASGQARNCEVLSVNLTLGGTLAAEPINMLLDGYNNHIRGGTIACENGSQAGVIKSTSLLCGVHDMTFTAAPGALRTATFVSEGPEAQIDNVTVVDGRQTITGYAVVDVRGTGSKTSNIRTVGYNGDTTSVPIKITAGTASNVSISGYSVPADLQVTGTRLPVTPSITFARSSGRAFTLGAVAATLEASTPDRLVYRLSAIITTVSGPEAFGVVAVSGYGAYVPRVLNASANDAGTANPYNAGVLTQPFTALFAATPSTVQGIQLILIVELTR